MVLHGFKAFDKRGTTIRVDEVITAMDGSCNRVEVLSGGDAICDAEHDCVTVGHDCGFHGVFCVMTVGHNDIISQCRAVKLCAGV